MAHKVCPYFDDPRDIHPPQEVYYISKLCNNLVSLGQLTETGHKVNLDNDELEVLQKHPQQLIMKVKRAMNKLYHIQLQITKPICLMASLEYPTWLSHACVGHVNFQALGAFVDKKMAAGVPLIRHRI